MKPYLSFFIAASLLASCSKAPEQTANYEVVPLPANIEMAEDDALPFVLNASTKIACMDDSLLNEAQLLQEYIATLTGRTLKIDNTAWDADNTILLTSTIDSPDTPEGYAIVVDNKQILIDGASAAGTFYGIQTLRKSIPEAINPSNVVFPAAVIVDSPRFGYRGAHIDVVRHFFPVDSVKEFIDILALHNINKMHWHLSDDQGWRVEIKKHPKLTELGSIRNGTCIGTDLDSSDSIPYGGFYTQKEIKDIINYAAKRHITIIPEIDLPGHMLGALKAYPELGCTGGPYEVWQRWGITDDVLCAGNDSIYTFLTDVLDEVCQLFPGEYIHIGGDECPKVRWQECPKCQAKIKALGLKSDANSSAEDKLQSVVMRHAANVVEKHGKKAIGWDEILEGGCDPSTVVMSWRNPQAAAIAAKQGHDAILTPTQYCYFDYIQAWPTDETLLPYKTYLPIERVYTLEPVDPELTVEEAQHILGAQANNWAEYIPTLNYLEYKLLPRLAALSEVQWMAPEKKNFDEFKSRLERLANIYDAEGYNYARFVFDADPNNPETLEYIESLKR